MNNDKQFDLAVQLACAFVANGDFHLEKIRNDSSDEALVNLIIKMYRTLDVAQNGVWRYAVEIAERVQAQQGLLPQENSSAP